MSGNDVKVTMDSQDPPALSDDQQAELEALKAKSDAEIDTSDIPELSDDFWRKAVRNPLYKPKKASTTVRIDADVLAWLRAQGPGYQTRINAILRREMEDTLKR